MNGGAWQAWNGARGETVNGNGESVAGVMCLIPNSLSNYPGNGQYWVC